MNNIAKTTNNLSIQSKPPLKNNEYNLAKIWIVFFARFFDFIFASIPGLILSYKYQIKENHWSAVVIILAFFILWMFIYYILIPRLFFKGNTFGKIFFGLRIVSKKNDNKIKLTWLFKREIIFSFVPWLILFIPHLVILIIMTIIGENNWNDFYASTMKIISNSSYVIYLFYLIILSWSIKVQTNHQASVDIKNEIFIVEKKKKEVTTTPNSTKTEKVKDHISLKKQPANFEASIIKDLKVDKDLEYKDSISIDRKSITNNKKISSKDIKKLEDKEGHNNE